MSRTQPMFFPGLRVFQIWGTRQGVGKTVASTILTWTAAKIRRGKAGSGYRDYVGHLKPIRSIDFGLSDTEQLLRLMHKMMQGHPLPTWFQSRVLFHRGQNEVRFHSGKRDDGGSGADLSDETLLTAVAKFAAIRAHGIKLPGGWLFMETLDGVEARLPSGRLQPDVYRPWKLPAILVCGGGASELDRTIWAYEALHRRDYPVEAVMTFRDETDAHLRVEEYFQERKIPVVALRPIPPILEDPRSDENRMIDYVEGMARSNQVRDLFRGWFTRHIEQAEAVAIGPDELDTEWIQNDKIPPASRIKLLKQTKLNFYGRPFERKSRRPGKNPPKNFLAQKASF